MRALLADLRGRVDALLHGGREDAELREEMAFHLAMEAESRDARGETGAVRGAKLSFGSPDRWEEEARDARGVRLVQDFVQDLRLAVRELRRRPTFTLTAVVTLALGMAGVAAVFSVLNRALLRPLPLVAEPERLVTVRFQEDEWNDRGLSYLNHADMSAALRSIDALVGQQYTSLQVLPEGGRAMNVAGATVIGDYFGALGLRPAHGRFFLPEEMAATGVPHVAVISHRLWREQFGGRDIASAEMRMNGLVFTIVGVAPRHFHGTEPFGQTDVWLPPSAYQDVRHFGMPLTERRTADFFFEWFALLAPGATPEQAERELTLLLDQLRAQYPEVKEQYEQATPRVYAGVGLAPQVRAGAQKTMLMMLGVAALVLLIACANVANLLMFRGLRARGEAAVRRALGASTARLLQYHAAQGVVLAIAAALVAIVLAKAALRSTEGASIPWIGALRDIPLDNRVLLFMALLVLLVTLLFTAVPTLLARAWPLLDNLRDAARTETGRSGWVRRSLVVVQIALSAALVVPALLLIRSVQNLNEVDVGFDPEDVYTFYANVEPQGYSDERRYELQQRLVTSLQAEPELQVASISTHAPFGVGRFIAALRGPLQPEGTDAVDVNANWISSEFFETLGVPLVRGSAADVRSALASSSSDVVIVSASAARALFGSVDVIGRTVEQPRYSGPRTLRIAAVVGDTRVSALREPPPPVVYLPLIENRRDEFIIAVRSSAPAAQVENIVTSALNRLDPAIPFFRAEPLSRTVHNGMREELVFARLAAVLGLLAALLAAIGLYGLMAYSVEQRRREIGIRMALGARVSAVVRLVTGETLRIATIGVVIGCAGGWALSRIVQHLFYGVDALSVTTYAAAGVVFAGVSLLSGAVPARTAARVQPATTLRQE